MIAHKNGEKTQTLAEHLMNVSKKAVEMGKKIGIQNIMFLVSLLHDLGKADRNFQEYILKNTKERINHSSAGARYLTEKIKERVKLDLDNKKEWLLFLEILEYVIFSHHGLYDVISDVGESRTEKRRNYDKGNEAGARSYYYEEDVKRYMEKLVEDENIDIDKYIEDAFKEFKIITSKINRIVQDEKIEEGEEDTEKEIERIKDEKRYFYYHCIVRLVLSILKEADINDTVNAFQDEPIESFEEGEIFELWEITEKNIEEKYRKFEKNRESSLINEVRKKLSETAGERGRIDGAGVYKLELPTGSGKTLTSFRYAVEQAKYQKKERIIYITAFLSVLEQNAEELKSLVKNDRYVLEHHSNMVEEEDSFEEENFPEKGTSASSKDAEEKQKEKIRSQYLLNSWDSPVILTTMVQFYNTLFKGKASNIRRFSKLINSVIIVDEVQSIPKKAIYMSNLMTNFMKYFMDCTIVHCTATQPCFDGNALIHKVMYGDSDNRNSDIVSMETEEKKVFERVEVYNCAGKNGVRNIGTEGLSDFIEEMYDGNESVLAILNTKKAVKNVYVSLKDRLKIPEENLYYLSTNMCAAHRLEKIKEIKEKLLSNEKIACISTQLIEAGVDVDFSVVIRSMTGIDSMIQSIGRCNREGKLRKGKFYIINYAEEEFKYLKEIKKTATATSGILEEKIKNIDDLREPYYNSYYINNLEDMRYKREENEADLLSLLSKNNRWRSEYKKRWGKPYNNYNIAQSFKKASIDFNLIDNETKPIIVNYDKNSETLIRKLREAIEGYRLPVIKEILKKLQRYTVNSYNIEKMKGFMEIHKEYGIYILLDEYYGNTGIETEELSLYIV